jgi:hypothetical protein
MRDLVLNRNFELIAVEQNKFIRDKQDWTIRTETMLKQYRQVYDKRILFKEQHITIYTYWLRKGLHQSIITVISVLRKYQIQDQISLCFIIFYLFRKLTNKSYVKI